MKRALVLTALFLLPFAMAQRKFGDGELFLQNRIDSNCSAITGLGPGDAGITCWSTGTWTEWVWTGTVWEEKTGDGNNGGHTLFTQHADTLSSLSGKNGQVMRVWNNIVDSYDIYNNNNNWVGTNTFKSGLTFKLYDPGTLSKSIWLQVSSSLTHSGDRGVGFPNLDGTTNFSYFVLGNDLTAFSGDSYIVGAGKSRAGLLETHFGIKWNIGSQNACSGLTNSGKLTIDANDNIICADDISGVGSFDPDTPYTWGAVQSFGNGNLHVLDPAGDNSFKFTISAIGVDKEVKHPASADSDLHHMALWGPTTPNDTGTYPGAGIVSANGSGTLFRIQLTGDAETVWPQWSISDHDDCASLGNSGKLTMDTLGNISCQADISGVLTTDNPVNWTGTHFFHNAEFRLFEPGGVGVATETYTFRTQARNTNTDLYIPALGVNNTSAYFAMFKVDPLTLPVNSVLTKSNDGELTQYGGLTMNIAPTTCTGDANGGKLTISNDQIVCAADKNDGGPGSGLITCTNQGNKQGIDQNGNGNCEVVFHNEGDGNAQNCIGYDYNDDGTGLESCGGVAVDIVMKSEGRRVNREWETYSFADQFDCPGGGADCTPSFQNYKFLVMGDTATVGEARCWCEGNGWGAQAPTFTIKKFGTGEDTAMAPANIACQFGQTDISPTTITDNGNNTFGAGQQISVTWDTVGYLGVPDNPAKLSCNIALGWEREDGQ